MLAWQTSSHLGQFTSQLLFGSSRNAYSGEDHHDHPNKLLWSLQPRQPSPRHFFISSFLPLYIFHYSFLKHCFIISFSFSVFFFFLFQQLNLHVAMSNIYIMTSWLTWRSNKSLPRCKDKSKKKGCGITEILQDKNSLTGRIVLKVIDTRCHVLRKTENHLCNSGRMH